MKKNKEIMKEGSLRIKKKSVFIITALILSSLGAISILIQAQGIDIAKQSNHDRVSVPQGYTLDSYTVEDVSDTSCQLDSECETPSSYLIQSRCPFTSICLENKCTVVCPTVDD